MKGISEDHEGPHALNTRDAASYLGVSSSFLEKARRGVCSGPAYARLGKRVVYPVAELDRFLNNNLVEVQRE